MRQESKKLFWLSSMAILLAYFSYELIIYEWGYGNHTNTTLRVGLKMVCFLPIFFIGYWYFKQLATIWPLQLWLSVYGLALLSWVLLRIYDVGIMQAWNNSNPWIRWLEGLLHTPFWFFVLALGNKLQEDWGEDGKKAT